MENSFPNSQTNPAQYMGPWKSVLSAGPLPSAASEKTPSISMRATSQFSSPFTTPVATTSAKLPAPAPPSPCPQLPSQARRRHCQRPHHPHPCSQLPSPPRQGHRLRPRPTTVHQHRRLLRAVRGALRFEKTQQCAPAPTAAAAPAPLSTRVDRHATCDMSNRN